MLQDNTLKTAFINNNNTNEILEKINTFKITTEYNKILMLSACSNESDINILEHILNESKLLISGGIFPAIIYNSEVYINSTILIGLNGFDNSISIPYLNIKHNNFDKYIDVIGNNFSNVNTLLIFIDGYSKYIDKFIEVLHYKYGNTKTFAGCMTGTHKHHHYNNVFCNNSLLKNAAVIVGLMDVWKINIVSNYTKHKGPFKVTGSDGNVVKSIDWQSAFHMYKTIIEKETGENINLDNFSEKTRDFSFGISRLSSDYIIRDPIIVSKDHSLICSGEVPENTFIDIIRQSNKKYYDEEITIKNSDILLLESYNNYLSDKIAFEKNIKKLNKSNNIVNGALTYGEIGNNGTEYLEYMNRNRLYCFLPRTNKIDFPNK